MPRSWLNATLPSVSLLPLLVVSVQVTDDESYAYFQQLVESSPAEFWEPVAQRELHWLHIHHCVADLHARCTVGGLACTDR